MKIRSCWRTEFDRSCKCGEEGFGAGADIQIKSWYSSAGTSVLRELAPVQWDNGSLEMVTPRRVSLACRRVWKAKRSELKVHVALPFPCGGALRAGLLELGFTDTTPGSADSRGRARVFVPVSATKHDVRFTDWVIGETVRHGCSAGNLHHVCLLTQYHSISLGRYAAPSSDVKHRFVHFATILGHSVYLRDVSPRFMCTLFSRSDWQDKRQSACTSSISTLCSFIQPSKASTLSFHVFVLALLSAFGAFRVFAFACRTTFSVCSSQFNCTSIDTKKKQSKGTLGLEVTMYRLRTARWSATTLTQQQRQGSTKSSSGKTWRLLVICFSFYFLVLVAHPDADSEIIVRSDPRDLQPCVALPLSLSRKASSRAFMCWQYLRHVITCCRSEGSCTLQPDRLRVIPPPALLL